MWRQHLGIYSLLIVIQLTSNNIFNLNEINNKMIENGSPIVTPSFEKKIFSDKIFNLYPIYTRVQYKVNNEGNLYIQIDDVSQTTFHLWGERHPKDPNYKFNTSANQVDKCLDSKRCVTMDYCNSGVIENLENNTEKYSNKTVFFSWKIRQNYITLLFQYQNKTFFCQDTNPIELKNIVIASYKKQIFRTSTASVIYLNDNTKLGLTNKTISLSSAYSFYISHCLRCNFNIEVECPNNGTEKITTKNTLPYVIYNNNFIIQGWKEIIVGLKNVSCFMKMKFEHNKNQTFNKFWVITAISESQENMSISRSICKRNDLRLLYEQNYNRSEIIQNYFNLQEINEVFFDIGSPLITPSFEKNIFTNKFYRFFPKYEIIETIVTDKGNLFIQTENIFQAIIYLNESNHEYCASYYKYNPAENFVEKCSETNLCHELEQCRFAVNENVENEKYSNRTVFISWQITKNFVNLVFQYQTNIMFCNDTNGLAIKKIILVSEKRQNYKISQGAFTYFVSKKPLNITLMKLNSSYFFYIRQCLTCSFNVWVNCPNYPLQTISVYNSLVGSTHKNHKFSDIWKKIIVGLQGVICLMKIESYFEKTDNITAFWAITAIGESQENMTITKTTNDSEDKPSDNNNKIILYSGVIIVVIVIIILIIILSLKYIRRSKMNVLTNNEEIPLEETNMSSETKESKNE